jgi:hypothetical protein
VRIVIGPVIEHLLAAVVRLTSSPSTAMYVGKGEEVRRPPQRAAPPPGVARKGGEDGAQGVDERSRAVFNSS